MATHHLKIAALICFSLFWGQAQSSLLQTRFDERISEKEINELLSEIKKNKNDYHAHFKLGKHYNQTGKWELAKKHLLKSYAIILTEKDFDKKAKTLYELAQTYRAVGEIPACEDALKGVKHLVTPKAKVWNSVVLQLAEALYIQNRFNEAATQLALYNNDDGESLLYEQLTHAISKAAEVDKIYSKAVTAESEGLFRKAHLLYAEIDAKFPGFKDVQERLNQTQSELLFGDTPTNSAAPENTNVELVADRGVSLEPKAAHKTAPPKKSKRRLPKENGTTSDNAQKKPNPIIPQTDKRSTKNTSSEAIIKTATNGKNISLPNTNTHSGGRLSKSNQLTHAMALVSTDLTPPNVQISIPKSEGQKSLKKTNKKKYIWTATFLAGFLLTGTGLTIYLNPFFRARTLTLIGRKETALQLYENLIAERPQMLWLYPYLAKLYDHFNRQDLKAIRVYKIIQHLSMHSNADDSFAANISNKYLSHETAKVQIEILNNKR